MGKNQNKVSEREGSSFYLFIRHLKTEALVEGVTPYLVDIITFRVKNRPYEFLCIFGGGQIAVTKSLVNFYRGFIFVCGVVFGQRLFYIALCLRITIKKCYDFLIG